MLTSIGVLAQLSQACDTVLVNYSRSQRIKNQAYLNRSLQHFELAKLDRDIVTISMGQLENIWDLYKHAGFLRKAVYYVGYESSSEESQSVKNALQAGSDEKRAELVREYMRNKFNWQLGFCVFLWDYFYLDKTKLNLNSTNNRDVINNAADPQNNRLSVEAAAQNDNIIVDDEEEQNPIRPASPL